MNIRFIYIIAALAVSVQLVCAQTYHTPFGHNRIQYKNFDWSYYATNNFEIYYYSGGNEYAKEALVFLETEFTKITDILGYAPYTKTKVFIYNSVHDLQQSNIGIGGDNFSIGGKTDFIKLQVELAYSGISHLFKEEMVHQLVRVLIQDMMYGGSLAEIFQNSYLLSLPEWFIDGAGRYLALGWSEEMDDYVRNYLSRQDHKKLAKLENERADILGQSIWNYIAIRYGASNISNVLNLTRIIRDEENSISSTLGVPFKKFLDDWGEYYSKQTQEIEKNYVNSDPELILAGHRKKQIVLNHVKLNAMGTKLAYVHHREGKYKVKVVDLGSGKTKDVESGGYTINDQVLDHHMPLLDWQDNEHLGVLLYKRGSLYLNVINIKSGETTRKPLRRFRQIESFSFNDNGKLAVISGDIDGQNDLFLISMRRNALKRITKDLYDDLDPVFVPGTAAIIFSSNRLDDSVKVKAVELDDLTDRFNLLVYDLDTTTYTFRRLTNTLSQDRKPMIKNDHQVYYLSDQKGIANLYRYDLQDNTFEQVSNFRYSIRDYDLAYGTNMIAYLMLDEGKQKVFLDRSFDFENKLFTPPTARKRMQQARYLAKRIANRSEGDEEGSPKDEPSEVNEEIEVAPDEENEDLVLPESYSFEEEEASEGEFIDTDNYVFEETLKKDDFKPDSFFSTYRKLSTESKTNGPFSYTPRFSFNNLVTSFGMDPIMGFGINLETEINDVLENHRLTAGAFVSPNIRSSEVFAEYQYLKFWMDFYVRFERNSYHINNQTRFVPLMEPEINQRYHLNQLEITAALPLTNAFRIEVAPLFASTTFNNLYWRAVVNGNSGLQFDQGSSVKYLGIRGALVFDNTQRYGYNRLLGSRGMLEYEKYGALGDPEGDFGRVKLDARHYQKIHREFSFATRAFLGHSLGPNRPQYMLGGMDNWLFNRFEDQGVNGPLQVSNSIDNSMLLFHTFVPHLRGFDYNEVYGNSVATFNAELRLPLFEYLSPTPLASPFLKSFEIISFYDIGAAWEGKVPLFGNRSSFVKTYVDGNFSAKLSNFQNPWLSSYGFGVRAILLGFYLKGDWARPITNGSIGDTRFYLTLGLDF